MKKDRGQEKVVEKDSDSILKSLLMSKSRASTKVIYNVLLTTREFKLTIKMPPEAEANLSIEELNNAINVAIAKRSPRGTKEHIKTFLQDITSGVRSGWATSKDVMEKMVR